MSARGPCERIVCTVCGANVQARRDGTAAVHMRLMPTSGMYGWKVIRRVRCQGSGESRETLLGAAG